MSYIGRVEQKSSDIKRFDVTSSTSATHTLSWSPVNEQSCIVTINGVKQHEDAYSVSGTTLTLTSPLVATDKLEVIGIQDVGQTVVPGTGVIVDSMVSGSAAIANSKIAGLATSATTDTTNASNISSGTLATARLGSGTADSTTFLRGDQTWAAAGGGKVLQVVSTFKNDTFSTVNTTTFLDVTGLSATITPSSSSNKILVFFNINIGPSSLALFRLMRDSTEIAPATVSGSHNSGWMTYESGDSNITELCSAQYLDSPATTSAVTYKVQIKNRGSTYTTNVNRSNSDSTDSGFGHRGSSGITLMEIAG